MDNRQFDQRLRSALDDFRPPLPPDGLEKLLGELPSPSGTTPARGKTRRRIILSLLAVVTLTALTWLFIPDEKIPVTGQQTSTDISTREDNTTTSLRRMSEEPTYEAPASVTRSADHPGHPQHVQQTGTDLAVSGLSSVLADSSTTSGDAMISAIVASHDETETVVVATTDMAEDQGQEATELALLPPAQPAAEAVLPDTTAADRSMKGGMTIRPGLYYRIDGNMNSTGSAVTHQAGVLITAGLLNDHLILRLAAGISILTVQEVWATDYEAYLGTYQHLDSVSFAWDQQHYHLLATQHLTPTPVWSDTISRESTSLQRRQYRMEIPLTVGWNWHTGALRWGPQAGARLSILTATRALDTFVDPGMNRIISREQTSPEAMSLQWQVMAGFHVDWKMGQTRVGVEPQVAFPLNGTATDQGRPWNIGLQLNVEF